MATEILMPQLGLTMEEGTVETWLKKVGDKVEIGDEIVEISTDKLVNVIESNVSGTVLKIVAKEGEDVLVKGVLAIIGAEGEELEDAPKEILERKTEVSPLSTLSSAFNPSDEHVVVIGGGPGGYVAAIRAAQLGAKVSLIEKETIGGTCLNVGCIPTKTLLHATEFIGMAKDANEYGVEVNIGKVDFNKIQQKKNKIVKQLVSGVTGLLRKNKVKVIEGRGKLLSRTEVEVTKDDGRKETISATKIILATGSTPTFPVVAGLTLSERIIDSTGALSLKEVPKSLVIVGGGVIGVEFASIYNALGSKVTIVEFLPQILATMDEDISTVLKKKFQKDGITILTSAGVKSVKEKEKGVDVSYELNGKVSTIETEMVLVATGRRPVSKNLGLESLGMELERGRVIVNEKQETSIAGIYAIGDLVGKIMLAHTASAMGEVAAENALGLDTIYSEKAVPSGVYTSLEIASVGLTEKQAIEQNKDYSIGEFPMMANSKALIENGGQGKVKVIIDNEYGEILGAHIIGPKATDLIAEIVLAIDGEYTVDELIGSIHGHPTVSEAVREAFLDSLGRAIHF